MQWPLLAFMIGCLIPFQGIITQSLSKNLQHPFGAAFINFFGGMLVFLTAILLTSSQTFPFKKIFTMPWYLYTGGLIGSFFIFGALFSLPRIGATSFFGLIVIGQLIMTIIVDHYGLFGIPVYKIDGFRILGISLLIIGSLLIFRKA